MNTMKVVEQAVVRTQRNGLLFSRKEDFLHALRAQFSEAHVQEILIVEQKATYEGGCQVCVRGEKWGNDDVLVTAASLGEGHYYLTRQFPCEYGDHSDILDLSHWRASQGIPAQKMVSSMTIELEDSVGVDIADTLSDLLAHVRKEKGLIWAEHRCGTIWDYLPALAHDELKAQRQQLLFDAEHNMLIGIGVFSPVAVHVASGQVWTTSSCTENVRYGLYFMKRVLSSQNGVSIVQNLPFSQEDEDYVRNIFLSIS